jgi:hypothetical protein
MMITLNTTLVDFIIIYLGLIVLAYFAGYYYEKWRRG